MESLLADTIEAVKAAGAAIMSYYQSSYDVSEKAPDHPLTEADLEADKILSERLRPLDPEAAWLSEESEDGLERLMTRMVWIVDPLDGTKEFIDGNPQFTVSVALAELGQPRLAVVYNPVTEELFYAERGQGVFYNDEPVAVTETKNLADAVIVASRTEVQEGDFEPFDDLVDVEPVGSTAYRMARVAAGLADAFWTRRERQEWDICAGVLLVVEAGGKCMDIDNKAITFNHHKTDVNGIIASNGHLHDQIVAALSERV